MLDFFLLGNIFLIPDSEVASPGEKAAGYVVKGKTKILGKLEEVKGRGLFKGILFHGGL